MHATNYSDPAVVHMPDCVYAYQYIVTMLEYQVFFSYIVLTCRSMMASTVRTKEEIN